MHKKLWNKDFILMLQGNVVSTVGDLMYSVAIGYWVYQQTGSSGLMGIMSSISMFVTMFLSPFCGSIVDKCSRKWLIVGFDIFQGLLMLTVGILASCNALSVPIVLIAAFLASFGSVFYGPAVSSLMLDIIPRDDMVRGQSLYSSSNSLVQLVGTAFSGVMVAFLGVPLIVVINGLSNLYSAATEFFVHMPRTVQEGTPVTAKGVLADSKQAVLDIFADKCLRLFVPCALLLNLLGAGPMTLVLPFCLEKGFSVDTYGYVCFAYMAGHFLGAIVMGSVKFRPKARFWVMALGFSCSIPMFILAYMSNQFWILSIFVVAASFLNCLGNSVFNASLMLALPETNRNAILGFISAAATGGTALSAVIYGFLGDLFPLYIIFSIGCLISLPVMLYMSFHRHTKSFILEHNQ